MPLIEATVFEGRLTPETESQLIVALTDAVVSVFGEHLRDATWVTLHEVPRSRWGFGGRTTPEPRQAG